MLKVTCAFILHNKNILITQNGPQSDHAFQWEFPGGKIEDGETAQECIIREIKEELELDIEILDSMHAIQHDYGTKKIELIPFVCIIKNGKLRLNNHINKQCISLVQLDTINFSAADEKLISTKTNREILKKYTRK